MVNIKAFLKFLSNNILYTVIEALGLTVSLAFVIVIGSYAWQQYAAAYENPDYKNIYLIHREYSLGSAYGERDALQGRVPEIEQSARVIPISYEFSMGAQEVRATAYFIDKEFFELFPYFEIIDGSADALSSSGSLLVSETFANTHGLQVGSTLTDGEEETSFTVIGIVEDFRNSLFPYADVLASPYNSEYYGKSSNPFATSGDTYTFVKLRPGSDIAAVMEKLEPVWEEVYRQWLQTEYPGNQMHATRLDRAFFTQLSSRLNKGDSDTLLTLSAVGLLLLLSAVFNYINLNFALTGKRAKEMATRRLLGATKGEIIARYILEALLFTALCFAAALLLATALAPVIDDLINNPDIPVSIVCTPATVGAFVLIVLVVGTLAGLLPALLASKFQPIDVVKGSFRTSNKMVFSKAFIIFQNAVAVFLIAMAVIMETQYQTSLNRPMHADVTDKFYFESWASNQQSLGDAFAALPGVKRVGLASGVPGFRTSGQSTHTRYGDEIMYRTYYMDSTAVSMLQIEKQKDFNAPVRNAVWMGDRTFVASGYDDDYHDLSNTLASSMRNVGELAGTYAEFPTKNSNMGEEEYQVIIMKEASDLNQNGGWLLETTGDHREMEQRILAAYRQWANETQEYYREPSTATYLTDNIREGMKPVRKNMQLLEIFMVLAILVSLLGLLAMSTYYAGESAHNIAVRKVFGSTVTQEVVRNLRGYMLMVLAACLIGIPLAVYAAGKYLESFIYRIENYWWLFVVAVVLAVVFALGTVFWQVLRAAHTNPVTELKKE